MVAAIDKVPVSFDEFLNWYPEDEGCRYELRRGIVVEMPKPRGKYSEIAGYLIKVLNQAIDAAGLPYFIPRECIVKVAADSGYEPDVTVVDRRQLVNEVDWERGSVLGRGVSVKLAVEVVSTNWRDDYALKMSDYERLGIEEYWIVDYLGIGGRRYIGVPKQPTVSVCQLVEGEYEVERFVMGDRLRSGVLPGVEIEVDRLLGGGV